MSNDDLNHLLKHMKPYLLEKELVFLSLSDEQSRRHIEASVAMVREAEGITLILDKQYADSNGLAYEGVYRQISLTIESSLESCGLTAAFSTKLAEVGIPTNVLAGYYHDHLLVPDRLSKKALSALQDLSGSAS